MAAVNQVYQALVYIGTRNYLGLVAKASLPGPTVTTSSHETIASIGSTNLPTGFEAMEGSFDWASMDESIMEYAANTRDVFDIQVRANIEKYAGQPNKIDVPMIYTMKARFKSIPNAEFAPKSNMESTSNFDVLFIKLTIAGVEQYSYDPINMIYKVRGVDLLATVRANFGLA